jgi:hypothetical protein
MAQLAQAHVARLRACRGEAVVRGSVPAVDRADRGAGRA